MTLITRSQTPVQPGDSITDRRGQTWTFRAFEGGKVKVTEHNFDAPASDYGLLFAEDADDHAEKLGKARRHYVQVAGLYLRVSKADALALHALKPHALRVEVTGTDAYLDPIAGA